MLDTVTLILSPVGEAEEVAMMESVLEGWAEVNRVFYGRYPNAPCCPLCAGIKYRRPEPGEPVELVCAEKAIVDGHASCGTLAAMTVGRMRAKGIDPKARVRLTKEGPRSYHAVVVRGDGSVKDPSAELIERGMVCNCE